VLQSIQDGIKHRSLFQRFFCSDILYIGKGIPIVSLQNQISETSSCGQIICMLIHTLNQVFYLKKISPLTELWTQRRWTTHWIPWRIHKFDIIIIAHTSLSIITYML
jgi:hypothetical protein